MDYMHDRYTVWFYKDGKARVGNTAYIGELEELQDVLERRPWAEYVEVIDNTKDELVLEMEVA